MSEHIYFPDVFISNVGKFGGKHGELEFGRGLGLIDFCATEINDRIVSGVVEGSDTPLQNNSTQQFSVEGPDIPLQNNFCEPLSICVKLKQLLCYIRCLCRSIYISCNTLRF
jgi:hypothetical protein